MAHVLRSLFKGQQLVTIHKSTAAVLIMMGPVGIWVGIGMCDKM
jgi:hypothetical protein